MQHQISIQEVTVDHLVKTNPHVDGGWFWSKYSANPYVGCQYGCTYCFLRQKGYGIGQSDQAQADSSTDPFSESIQVRVNAAAVLDRELSGLPPDVIITGDYQPVDNRYRITCQLLEVCLAHRFPVVVITKSPAILQDLDVIRKLHQSCGVSVVFSIAFGESTPAQKILEPFAASIESRFAAMKKIAADGIYTGTSLIPVMPGINDDDATLLSVIRQTHACGGRFVMAGGLVLGDQMEEPFHQSLRQISDGLLARYQQLYQGGYAPRDDSWRVLGNKVKQWCMKESLEYRMRRPAVADGDSARRRNAEELFLNVYEMELAGADPKDIETMRRMAWAEDEECPSIP